MELLEGAGDEGSQAALMDSLAWVSGAERAVSRGLEQRPPDGGAAFAPEGSYSLEHVRRRAEAMRVRDEAGSSAGVMRYLEEKKAGVHIAGTVVPIVPAAILMDLGVGDFHIRPNAESGYGACMAASAGPVAEGNVGAGAGATIGKMFGPKFSMKSGLGTASVTIGDTGIVVGAMVAVNAVGDVVDPHTGKVVAGARSEDGKGYRDSMEAIMKGYRVVLQNSANTTIGIIATNAPFTKVQMNKIAQMAHDGYARAINPVHTMSDGDTIFAMSTGVAKVHADVTAIGAIAATVMSRAIVRAAMQATSLVELGFPAYRDYAGRF